MSDQPLPFGQIVKALMRELAQERPDLKRDPWALAEEAARRARLIRQSRKSNAEN
jgi:hypothetical protein